jgi:hypothetical protein
MTCHSTNRSKVELRQLPTAIHPPEKAADFEVLPLEVVDQPLAVIFFAVARSQALINAPCRPEYS